MMIVHMQNVNSWQEDWPRESFGQEVAHYLGARPLKFISFMGECMARRSSNRCLSPSILIYQHIDQETRISFQWWKDQLDHICYWRICVLKHSIIKPSLLLSGPRAVIYLKLKMLTTKKQVLLEKPQIIWFWYHQKYISVNLEIMITHSVQQHPHLWTA